MVIQTKYVNLHIGGCHYNDQPGFVIGGGFGWNGISLFLGFTHIGIFFHEAQVLKK